MNSNAVMMKANVILTNQGRYPEIQKATMKNSKAVMKNSEAIMNMQKQQLTKPNQ